MTLTVREAVSMVRMVRKSSAAERTQHRHREAASRACSMVILEHVTPVLGTLPVCLFSCDLVSIGYYECILYKCMQIYYAYTCDKQTWPIL